MSNAIDLRDKLVYLIVTGASRGIGKKIAIETSKKIKSGSVVVLIARSLEGLEATRSEILSSNEGLNVIIKPLDLTKPSIAEFEEIIASTFDKSVNFELAIAIHNVGTLGDISKWVKDISSYEEIESYFSVNVHAPTMLNNCFLKIISSTKKLIVNITSKAAIAPFKSFGFYCMGKAAREMYFRVLAEEERNLLVLNYSPGPVESDMTVYAQSSSVSNETSGMFKQLRDTGTILTTEQTTKKFLDVIANGNYNSGDHIDYYDEI